MRVAIYQPRYFPQLHYFNRMIDSDVFVVLDAAQYTKSLVQINNGIRKRFKSFQSDTPIKLPSGLGLLTVPVHNHKMNSLNKTTIDYTQKWEMKHLYQLKIAYQNSLNFDGIYPHIKAILLKSHNSLASLNLTTIVWSLLFLLGYDVSSDEISLYTLNSVLALGRYNIRLKKIVVSSELDVERPEGLQKGTEWTAAICEKLGATEYFHGETAKNSYMDPRYYEQKGITTVTQKWQSGEYTQLFGKVPFLPNLSILDLLFNISRPNAQRVIGIL